MCENDMDITPLDIDTEDCGQDVFDSMENNLDPADLYPEDSLFGDYGSREVGMALLAGEMMSKEENLLSDEDLSILRDVNLEEQVQKVSLKSINEQSNLQPFEKYVLSKCNIE